MSVPPVPRCALCGKPIWVAAKDHANWCRACGEKRRCAECGTLLAYRAPHLTLCRRCEGPAWLEQQHKQEERGSDETRERNRKRDVAYVRRWRARKRAEREAETARKQAEQAANATLDYLVLAEGATDGLEGPED